MRVLLISTYELGHQPLHVASPATALRRAGHDVRALDLGVDPWAPSDVMWADAPRPGRSPRLGGAGGERPAAWGGATRGRAPRCRHGRVRVVYEGRIRIAAPDAVAAEGGQLVGGGARHITFGDPDFLNGVHH